MKYAHYILMLVFTIDCCNLKLKYCCGIWAITVWFIGRVGEIFLPKADMNNQEKQVIIAD